MPSSRHILFLAVTLAGILILAPLLLLSPHPLLALLFVSAFTVWPAFSVATWRSAERRLARWVLGVLFIVQLAPLACVKLLHEPDAGRRDDAMIGVTVIVAISFCISVLVVVAGQAPRWFGEMRGRGSRPGA